MKKVFVLIGVVTVAITFWLISRQPQKTDLPTQPIPAKSHHTIDCPSLLVQLIRKAGLQSGQVKSPPIFSKQRELFADLHRAGLLTLVLNNSLENLQHKLTPVFEKYNLIRSCSQLSAAIGKVCVEASLSTAKMLFLQYQQEAAKSKKDTTIDRMDRSEFSVYLNKNHNLCERQ